MCGSPLTWRGFPGEREREICQACGWVYYPQLKVGAAAVMEKDAKLLLVRRDQDPWKGCWNLPAGYLEDVFPCKS
jgi:NADH pyrophosphatase NudC (nudix superfamily)